MNRATVACAATLALVALAGCGGKPTAKQVIDKSATAYKNVRTLAITGENGFELRTGGQWQGRGSEVVIKYSKPDKVLQETPGQPTLILNGKKAVLYNPTEKMYMDVPAEMVKQNLTGDQSGASLLGPVLNKDPFKDAKNPKLLPDAKVGGVDTYVVEYQSGRKLSMPGLDKSKVTEKVWIGKEDWLVHKREMNTEVPKEVMQQQGPPGAPAQAAKLKFSSEAKKMVVNGDVPASTFQAPKSAKKMQSPAPGGAMPPGAAPKR